MTKTAKSDRVNKRDKAQSAASIPAADAATHSKAESKVSRVIALLQREEGVSLSELVSNTGWQPHTTRAALTGLRKKGHLIDSDKVDGVRRYRLAAAK